MDSETALLWAGDDNSVSRDGGRDVRDISPELTVDIEQLGSNN